MTRTGSRAARVVQGTEPRGLFPTTKREVQKHLLLDGLTQPFDARGGAYAQEVRTVGAGTVEGPILAGATARLEVEAPGIQRLLGGVSAHREVSTQPIGEGAADLDASPTVSPDGIRFVIRGDVAAGERVTLRNALVLGSVRAPAVRLESSIVLGRIAALAPPGELYATCSTFGVYDTQRVTLEGPTTIIVAGGSSDEEPDCRDHQPAEGGEIYPFSMRFLSLCRQKKIGCGLPNSALKTLPDDIERPERFSESPGICCAYWLHGACPFHRAVALGGADFIQAESGAQPGKRWYFGLQNRGQNMTPVVEADAFFDSVLHRVFAYEHLSEKARGRLLKDLKGRRLSAQEARLLRMTIEGV